MLLLSRKEGDTVIIGDDVIVKVVKIGGGKVVLGIEAPRERAVWRGTQKALPPLAPLAEGGHS